MSTAKLTTLFFILLIHTVSYAQLVCDFEADTTRACAPHQIKFTDLSTSSRPIIYWQWDFGNSGFSNLQNPSRVYTTPGKYTVKLIVSDGVDTATKVINQYIHIFKVPVANFQYTSLTNCKPMPVTFRDNTTLGDAPIRSYSWDFGDLSPPGSGSNTIHNYAIRGTYSVFLTVVDTNGCSSTSNPQNIVVDAPEAKFTATPRAGCVPPLNVTFSNSSQGRAPMSYLWIFGDGGTSTSANPTHNYTTSGAFDVTLVVIDSKGCTDTLKRTKYITIGQTKADFIFKDTVCLNALPTDTIFNTSTGASNFKWTIGSSTSTDRDPLVSFGSPGWKTITLVADAGPNCKDSITKQVYVEDVFADFTISYDSICVPNFVTFKDSSSGNVTSAYYHIDMGPTQTDVIKVGKNTSHKFEKSPCRNTYYKVNYHVETANGCKATKSKQVKIFNDQLFGAVSTSSPCVPANATFSATPCLRFKAIKWSWDFGTGDPADTSNVQNPSNVIPVPISGRYIAKVTVTDSVGCKYTHNVPYEVGAKQKANFTFPDDTICFNDTVHFTNLSTDSSLITSYAWDFGDKKYSTLRHPKHPYLDLGRHKIELVVWNLSCEDTISKYIYVSGPRVSIVTQADCKSPLNQRFLGNIVGGYNRFKWDFDDGTVDSTNITVNHTYSKVGVYKANLVAINDTTGCKDSISITIDPKVLDALFTPLTLSFCQYTEVQYDATPSLGNINGQYFWDFGDGSTDNFIRKPKHTFNKSGSFKVRLIVISTDSCMDTMSVNVVVTGVNPNFSIPTDICTDDSMLILNTSTPDTTIYSYRWKIDDVGVGLNKDLKHVFTIDPAKMDTMELLNKDTVEVKVVMRDIEGCSDSITKNVVLRDLDATYLISDSTACRGEEVIFSDYRLPSNADYIWLFGDGDSSQLVEPKHQYANSGTFLSKYIVKDSVCADTMEIPITIQGIDSVRFAASLVDTNCYPATIFFDDYSTGDSISWRTWDFGDGIVPIRSPLKDSLTKTFTKPGLYTVKVVVETSNGCLDSVEYTDYIHIKGPYAEFSVYPDSICTFEEMTFVRDTTNIYTKSLIWDFADGRVDSTDVNVDTLRHVYTTARKMLAILLYEDSAGTCKKFYSQDVVVEDVHASFNFDGDSIGCVPFTTSFKDRSIDGNQWDWQFGDGGSASSANPNYTFNTDGEYDVTLYYSNVNNECKDTVKKSVLVHPLPIVDGYGDTSICVGDSVQLKARGALDYVWGPNQFINSVIIDNPKAAPPQTYIYTVIGKDTNSCVNQDQVNVFVIQIPSVDVPDDQQIIIGEEFDIKSSSSSGVTYRWEPSTGLSCADCANPTAKPLENTTYTLFITDTVGCFEAQKSFSIEVIPKFSVDVPDAFTPNGDGSNDIIFPNGWGIEDILEFKVYNRWGELVFEATNEIPGWDGYYKGELQNVETYVYYVKAVSYGGEVQTKEGYFSLLR